MKIGEFLVQQGLINKFQLKEALEAQLIFGGHLGTCLMERGFITERQIGKVLSEILGVGYAPPEFFEKIPQLVIETLPDKLVDRHLAIPFRLQDRILDTAMVRPQDLAAGDELSFASGYKVKPWVAPEARILQAMERYYDIRRSVRYVTLCRDTDKPRHPAVPPEVPSGHKAHEVQGQRPERRPTADAERLSAPIAAATATEVLAPPAESDPLSGLSNALLHAESVDKVSELVVTHGMRTLERCIVLLVKKGAAFPWQGRGWPCDSSKWSHVNFDVTSEPIFSLLDGEDVYRGPIPREPKYLHFYRTLRLDVPKEVIIAPARVDDRLVAVFYGDGGTDDKVLADDNYYRRLVRKFGFGLNLVESRRRLLFA
jgi:hypothetical protein